MSAAADPAEAGRQPEGAEADAVDQRRLRGPAGAHPHAALREAAVQGGHPQAGHRLHQLLERARAHRPQRQQRVLQRPKEQRAAGRTQEDHCSR